MCAEHTTCGSEDRRVRSETAAFLGRVFSVWFVATAFFGKQDRFTEKVQRLHEL